MLATAFSLVLSTSVAFAQQAQPAAPPPGNLRIEDLPWPSKLGLRAAAVDVGMPLVRQVVLVPDLATWLDELGRWSTRARWPVLLEDDRFTPLFVRGFKPERILRRSSVGPAIADRAALEAACRSAMRAAWGGQAPEATTGAPPPAVVLTDLDDPALPAAVALAAGRGLPLVLLEGDFGQANDVLDDVRFRRLEADVRAAVASAGLPFESLGDAIDAVVICRTLAAKARVELPANLRMALPPEAPVRDGEPLAVTDLLGRNADGARYAIAGWIFGPSPRATYMAMCSLFLTRDDAWFVNTYGGGEPWIRYAPDSAADALRAEGFSVRVTAGDQASPANWLRILMGGVSTDLLVMNSSGDPDWFNLFGGERGRTPDMPILNKPLAVHLVHSWSLARPDDVATIGGRLLDLGAYAIYGSVQEPLLFAFVPPANLIPRCLALGPFLVSARLLDGQFDRPWRLTAIGDPLMTILPDAQRKQRVIAPLPPMEGLPQGTVDVRTEAMQAMRRFAASGSAEDLTLAFRDLLLLGEDQTAIGLWKVAKSRGASAVAAPFVLGSFFRARESDDFVEAFRLVESPTSLDKDMLWHLLTPRIPSLDDETLKLLRLNIRQPDASVDLSRLVVGFDRRFGRAASDRVVREEMDKSADPNAGRRLAELLRRP